MIHKSPIRYAGNKFQLLPKIMQHLPKGCTRVIDAFGGSGVVSLNMPMRSKLYNELSPHTFGYVDALLNAEPSVTLARISKVIQKFELSKTNKAGYDRLRAFANKKKDPLLFYILSRYSFSNLSRFNVNGEFTVSFGAGRGYITMERETPEIETFWNRLNRARRTNWHYADVLKRAKQLDLLDRKTFIYFDPPYLASAKITSYAEWSHAEDARLRRNLDKLTDLGVRWMMSNVFSHKTYENPELRKWAKRYTVIPVKASYRFSRVKDQRPPEEILIINY